VRETACQEHCSRTPSFVGAGTYDLAICLGLYSSCLHRYPLLLCCNARTRAVERRETLGLEGSHPRVHERQGLLAHKEGSQGFRDGDSAVTVLVLLDQRQNEARDRTRCGVECVHKLFVHFGFVLRLFGRALRHRCRERVLDVEAARLVIGAVGGA
jgi:hypothetical protein